MRTIQYTWKNVLISLLCLVAVQKAFSQNVGISTSSSFTPDASAALDVSNTSKGLLIPRVALTANNVAGPISSPAISLLVYNTATAGTSPNNVVPGYYYWTGSAWFNLLTSTQNATASWSTTGNTGIVYNTNFLGNTDNAPLRFRTNNTQRAILDSLGNFGIGTEAFDPNNPEKVLIRAGTTTSTNLINANGSINNYLQFNVQNLSSGANASTDIVATANNGTDAAGYIDMGINSSGYATNTGVTAQANTAYIYSAAADLVIGNGAQNRNLVFFTNSGTTSTTATPNGSERMRIGGTNGYVGIGTTAPAQPLDVAGNINATGSVIVDGATTNAGTASPGVIFGGSGSGETISSKRTSGTNQYGIDFYTSSNLRMSVANGGNVGIGTNTPANKLTVAGIISPSVDNNSAYTLGTSALRWSVVYATNGAIQTSDRRLKMNIKNLNYGLKEVLALQPVSYNWKDRSQPQHKIGLIAQDVRKLVPEVVSGNEAKEKLGMNYSELVPVLINAIKEQQHLLDKQQKEIEALKKVIGKR